MQLSYTTFKQQNLNIMTTVNCYCKNIHSQCQI